ncbi:MAG: DUF481 domain-containing protein [Candidatus Saccharicenans sp.]|nr:MAG: hypothetical protein C0168_05635 [Candidatus Aminicenantes bacterium]HEK85332.1 DUF481 domain-containing protein [Candidatus Aminicenantes bacterium]
MNSIIPWAMKTKIQEIVHLRPGLKSLLATWFAFVLTFFFLFYHPLQGEKLPDSDTKTRTFLESQETPNSGFNGGEAKLQLGESTDGPGIQEKIEPQEKTTEQKSKEQESKGTRQEPQNKAAENSQANEKKSQASGESEKKKDILSWLQPWKKTIELSYVVTGGNTVSSSFSFGNTFIRTPNEKDTYTIKTFFLRTHSTTISRKAIGTQDSFTIEEEKNRQLTAENYLVSGQYDHRVSGRLITNLAFVWDRNKFSGVEGRALWTGGAGLILADTSTSKVRTQAGLSFTLRKYTAQSLSSFLGFRYTFLWDQKLFDNASFSTAFIFDDNLTRISDWRYEWSNNLTAPLSKSLALKTSVKIMRNHRPPGYEVALYNPDGTATGLSVSIPRQKVDTFFTTTIVFNF